MDTTIQRKPGQLWLAPQIHKSDDTEELYVLIKSTDSLPMRSWEVLRFRNRHHENMISLWTEEVMENDELVLDAQ